MRKSIYLILLICISYRVSAQTDTIAHIIERGESIEYLAERYNTSVDEIKQCNPLYEEFFTGLEINIPVIEQNSVTTASTAQYDSYYASQCKQADALLSSGEYKKAEKAYSELIKSYSATSTCTDAYYGRALAYYNRGKWKRAISDFETALDDSNLSSTARTQCEELLANARTNREQQLEERSQMWGELFAVAAVTTANVIAAKQQAKAAKQQAKYASRSSSSSSGGYEVDDEEVATSSGKSSCKGPRKYNCGNTGDCALCGGDGLMDDEAGLGQGANSFKCTLCGGSGRCKYCSQ